MPADVADDVDQPFGVALLGRSVDAPAQKEVAIAGNVLRLRVRLRVAPVAAEEEGIELLCRGGAGSCEQHKRHGSEETEGGGHGWLFPER